MPPIIGVMTTMDDARFMRFLNVDFLELLVRANDSAAALRGFINRCPDSLIIHAPERIRWEESTVVLDLASPEEELREQCVRRISEIIDVADGSGVPVVLHPGGVRRTSRKNPQLPFLLRDSLSQLKGRVWIENMPLRYHCDGELLHCHLLVNPEEFEDILPLVDGITLDVSHAYLSGGGNEAIRRFLDQIGESIRHLHLSDARYPDGEGMQLGEGDIDFSFVDRVLHLPLLLEVRGGHENGGDGFREAVRRVREEGFLDRYLDAKHNPDHVPGSRG